MTPRNLDDEEIYTLIKYQEQMRDDAIGSGKDEEAKERRARIAELRDELKYRDKIRGRVHE